MKRPWFKRKQYGWGWYPVTWEGWLLVLTYIVAVVFFVLRVNEFSSGQEIVFDTILPLLFLSFILVYLSYKRGERPRWQWGDDDKGKNKSS